MLAELATRLRARTGAAKAVAAVRDLLNSRRYEVVFVNRSLLAAAPARMERYRDKVLSLPDFASFAGGMGCPVSMRYQIRGDQSR